VESSVVRYSSTASRRKSSGHTSRTPLRSSRCLPAQPEIRRVPDRGQGPDSETRPPIGFGVGDHSCVGSHWQRPPSAPSRRDVCGVGSVSRQDESVARVTS
jgi:hypothetical protein